MLGVKGCTHIRRSFKTLLQYNLLAIVKAKASVRNVSASYAGFLYIKNPLSYTLDEGGPENLGGTYYPPKKKT